MSDDDELFFRSPGEAQGRGRSKVTSGTSASPRSTAAAGNCSHFELVLVTWFSFLYDVTEEWLNVAAASPTLPQPVAEELRDADKGIDMFLFMVCKGQALEIIDEALRRRDGPRHRGDIAPQQKRGSVLRLRAQSRGRRLPQPSCRSSSDRTTLSSRSTSTAFGSWLNKMPARAPKSRSQTQSSNSCLREVLLEAYRGLADSGQRRAA